MTRLAKDMTHSYPTLVGLIAILTRLGWVNLSSTLTVRIWLLPRESVLAWQPVQLTLIYLKYRTSIEWHLLIQLDFHDSHSRVVLVEKMGIFIVNGVFSCVAGMAHFLGRGGLVGVCIFVLGMLKWGMMLLVTKHLWLHTHSTMLFYLGIKTSLLMWPWCTEAACFKLHQ